MNDWKRAARVLRNPVGLIGSLIIAVLLITAILGTVIAPHDPNSQDLMSRYLPPAWLPGGSSDHLLGTDHLGRDMLSRVIAGARISVVVGVGAVAIQMLIGVVLGVVAGFRSGFVDAVVMRITDVWLAIPFLVLAMALSVVLGAGVWTTIVVLGSVGWVTFARIVRAQALSLRERDFVLASKVSGVSSLRTMQIDILPNVLASLIVLGTLQMSQMIIAEASLSFLGLGVQPPDIAWGSMIAEGRNSLSSAWWVATAPGVAIVIATLGINLLGDALRDELDPKTN